MEIPPKKPHFFKPILPGFKNGIKIPVCFLKYLKGQEHFELAVLKRAGKKWRVKLNDHRFEEGWGKFAEEFDLKLGDLLVFRHDGNMEFEVSIFDSSHFDREYTQEEEHEDGYEAEEEEVEVEVEDDDEYEAEEEDEDYEEAATQDKPLGQSHCDTEYPEYMQEDELEEEEEDNYEAEEEDDDDEYEAEEEEDKDYEDEEEEKEAAATKDKPLGQSHCDRECPEYMQEDEVEEEDDDDDDDEYKAEEEDKEYEDEDYEEEEEEEEEEEAATQDKPHGQSHFECTITRYCLSRSSTMFLPQKFAIANGLTNKKCKLIVRDERQRSWKLKLSSSKNTRPRAYIGDGWRKFIAENCIKEGDRIMFEVVTNGKTPIWKFQVVTDGETPVRKFQEKPSPNIELSNKTSSPAEAAPNTAFVRSHFECTIRQYCFSRGLLYLPKQFAFANGFIRKKCDLIIRDERQRSWTLKLHYCEIEVYIRDGWLNFIADNCLKEGDRIMFEVVTNGETPIWKFQVIDTESPLQKFQDIMKKPSNMSPLNAQVSTSTSGDDDEHPYFISTIKPYCISKTEFCLPLDFAKSNGLTNRKCEMILKDEAQRCWSVWLGRMGNRFGITRGWAKFRAENGLKVGDAYKFELIKNGEIPIAHFHCKYSAKVAKRKKQ